MLFTIELSDAVASFVVLTEIVLLLPLVKDGVVVPGRSGLGVGTSVLTLPFKTLTARETTKGASENHSHRGRAQKVAS
jgi:hypothetical protein